MRLSSRSRLAVTGSLGAAAIIGLLAWHGVDDSLSADDRRVIPQYLAGIPAMPAGPVRRYQDEIDFIVRVQRAVLRIAPRNVGLPYDATREPGDLLRAGHGLCYDRSRAIEKILRYAGFEVRHISLYSTRDSGSALAALATAGTPSHAVSEVRTREGWLVLDSDDPWVSLDASNGPVAMQTMKAAASGAVHPQWKTPVPNGIYLRPFTFVYGLYSRHGRFYPPYDFIPDVNYTELVQNVR